MCTGLEVVALLASAAGSGLQLEAASQEKSAMNKAAEAELARQAGFTKKGQASLQESLQQSTPNVAQKQIGEGARKALNEYQQVQSQPLTLSQASLNVGPQKDSIVNAQRNQAVTGQYNQNASQLQGYSDYGLKQWIKDLQANTALRLNANQAQQSGAILPLELQQAAQSSAGLAGFGSLLGTAGGLLGTASASGALGGAPSGTAGMKLYPTYAGANPYPIWTP